MSADMAGVGGGSSEVLCAQNSLRDRSKMSTIKFSFRLCPGGAITSQLVYLYVFLYFLNYLQ